MGGGGGIDTRVRLSSLEIGFSSSDKIVEMEIDIVASKPSSSSQPQILQALKETYSLKEKHIGLENGSNSLMKL